MVDAGPDVVQTLTALNRASASTANAAALRATKPVLTAVSISTNAKLVVLLATSLLSASTHLDPSAVIVVKELLEILMENLVASLLISARTTPDVLISWLASLELLEDLKCVPILALPPPAVVTLSARPSITKPLVPARITLVVTRPTLNWVASE